jgi:hypothetical protein
VVATSAATLGFSSTDANPGTLECALDASAYGACTSSTSFAVSGLGEGAHTLHVRSTDAAGNSSMLERTFAVDTLAPVVTITGSPAANASTTASEANLVVSLNEGTATCTLDGVAAACGGFYGNRSLGRHQLFVTATDALGHTSTATYAWTVVAASTPTRLGISKLVLAPRVAATTPAALQVRASVRVTRAATVTEALTVVKVVRVHRGSHFRTIRRVITVGAATRNVRRAGAVTIIVRLNRTGRSMLAATHRLNVTATTTVRSTAPRSTVRRVAHTTLLLASRRVNRHPSAQHR